MYFWGYVAKSGSVMLTLVMRDPKRTKSPYNEGQVRLQLEWLILVVFSAYIRSLDYEPFSL